MKQPKVISKIPIGQKIVLMESDSNYTIFYLENGQKILSGYNLKFYENITDSQSFMRLNRSEMINKTFVKRINLEEFSLTLNNGRRVHISRRRMKAFQAWI
jgi:two-component system LytT family response regulator